MKELNALQMEEIEGGALWSWGCLAATAWATSTALTVAGLSTNPFSAVVAAAFISEAVAASAAMIAACT